MEIEQDNWQAKGYIRRCMFKQEYEGIHPLGTNGIFQVLALSNSSALEN